ncbi:MAG: hypothetical protein PVH96_01295 [Gemmatimonadota bacterium]|jgi:hypothetical protein
MRPFVSILACALLACPSALVAQEQLPRSLSFDTRYVTQPYSNEAVAQFGIEILDLAVTPAELVTVGGSGGHLLRGILVMTSTGLLSRAYKLSFHEFGHGTRGAAWGFHPYFGYGGVPLNPNPAELDDDFFSYFAGSLWERGGYTYLPAGDTLFSPPGQAELDAAGFTMVWKAAGINNEMLISEKLEDRIRRGGAHAGMLTSWAFSKIAPDRYGNAHRIGDVDSVLDWYDDQGFEIERGDLRSGAIVATLASASTYELVYRTGRVLAGDPIRYRAWAPFGVELPNVSFYLTSSGISYKVSSGYRLGRWRFPVKVERVFRGHRRTEYTVGGEWAPGPYHFGTRVTIGEHTAGAAFVDRLVAERFLVAGGYTLYDSRNLLGERMIPSIESGPRYNDFFLRVGVVY